MDNLKRVVGNLKDKLTKSELERKLGEATTNDNWGVPITLLHQISERTFSSGGDRQAIMKHAWDTLRVPGKEWKRIYKALGLIEHLLKFGAPQCVQEIRDEAFRFRQLLEFNFLEDGSERGNGIRDKAKFICHLIADFQQLEMEREAARKMAGRYVGISAEQYMSGGSPNVSSFSSSSYNPASYAPSSYVPSNASSNISSYDRSASGPSYQHPDSSPQPFQPPAYAEPNLFVASAPSGRSNTQLTDFAQKQPPTMLLEQSKSQAKPVTNLFEMPKASPPQQSLNLFEAKPAPVQQSPSSLFALPPKPQPQAAAVFSMPPKVEPQPVPTHFTIPQKTEQRQTGLFTLPSNSGQNKTPLIPPQPPQTTAAEKPQSQASTALDGLFSSSPAVSTAHPGYAVPAYPGYQKYGAIASVSSPAPMIKVHHNMGAVSGPTISQLKTTPSMVKSELPKSEAPKKLVDLESFLVDLDQLRVESKEKSDTTHLHGFGGAI